MYLKLGVVFVTLFQIIIAEKCVTPNQEEAECVSIYSCKILIDAVFKANQSDIIEFVKKSKCEGRESDRMVCCGSTSRFLAPMINNNSDKDKLLPDRRYCGYQHSDDYFRDETTVGINEFPWLAGLLYKINNKTLIRCSGSLISNKYVLTAAYCTDYAIQRRSVVGVRLGEYNIKTDEDCTEDSSFHECSERPKTFDIEKIIVHKQYSQRPRVHDIALLRLSKTVQYSDYIRPICLPTAETMFAKPGDVLLASGWGSKERDINVLFKTQTETKKKIPSQLITIEECAAEAPPLDDMENHFCTKDLENNTDFSTHLGDNGAPAIFSFRKQWHQEGVLSYSIATRTSVKTTSVYIKVANYLDWIKENIEP